MLKELRSLKTLAIILFFTLCVPSVTWGNDAVNNYTETESVHGEIESQTVSAEPEETESIEAELGFESVDTEPTEAESTEEELAVEPIESAQPIEEEPSIEEEPIESAQPIEEEPSVEEAPIEEEPIEDVLIETEFAEESIEEAETVGGEPIKEELNSGNIETAERVILTSVEGLPSEAIVEFTLDGVFIGSVSNGIIIDAVPILATDKQRIKASVANKVRIVGAKIHFDTYVDSELKIRCNPNNEAQSMNEQKPIIEEQEPIGEKQIIIEKQSAVE